MNGSTSVEYGGGGIFCYGVSPTISRNLICGNRATNSGGGIDCYGGAPQITNNLLVANVSYHGGALSINHYCSAAVANNTIVGNSATHGGGIFCGSSDAPTISNNIVAFNSSGIFKYPGPGEPTLQNNDVCGNRDYDYCGLPLGENDISQDVVQGRRRVRRQRQVPRAVRGHNQPGMAVRVRDRHQLVREGRGGAS